MRIDALELIAYGPFTDRAVDLSGGEQGVHVIFGPNEAGKSAALRALRGLLFGIPMRTRDNFLHENPKLRIGGRLRSAAGGELHFVRRKGRKRTVLDEGGQPLDESALVPFLAGLGEDEFRGLYSIDHDELVAGGEAMLAGEGRIGESLFSAGAGALDLRKLLAALEDEAGDLFKPTGSKPRINALLRRHAELKRTIRDCRLRGKDWEALRQDRADAERRRGEFRERLTAARTERNRLERIENAIPLLARRRELLGALAGVGEVRILPEGFGEKRRGTDAELARARAAVKREQEKQSEIDAALAELRVPQELIARGERIQDLLRRLGQYLSGKKDLPGLQRERDQHLRRAAEIAADVRKGLTPDEAAEMFPTAGQRSLIEELGAQLQKLRSGLETAVKQKKREQRSVKAAREDLAGMPEAPDPAPLKRALRVLRKAETDLARLDDRIDAAREEQDAAEAEIGRLTQDGVFFTEEDLAEARRRRDAGWLLIRDELAGRGDAKAAAEYAGANGSLSEAYERAVAHADRIADGLREKSDQSARLRILRKNQETAKEKLEGLQGERDERLSELERQQDEWASLCSSPGGEPLPADEPIAQRIERVEEAVEKAAGLRKQHEKLENTIADADKRVRDAKLALADVAEQIDACRLQWGQAVECLGLSPESTAAEARAVMECLQSLSGELREAEGLSGRIEGIEADADAFRKDVTRLCAEAAADLRDAEPDQAVEVLGQRRLAAEKARDRRDALTQQREERRQAEEAERENVAKCNRVHAALCKEAGASDPEELPELEDRSEQARKLQSEIHAVEQQLTAYSAGESIDALAEQAAEEDPDALPGRKAELKDAIDGLEKEIAALGEVIGGKNSELARMDGKSEAADAAEELQQVAAETASACEQYVRLRLAGVLLRREIERYRQANQGPVLERAGVVFARLTRGSFEGVRPDYDKDDNPILVGVRGGGGDVRVEGMSDGTRDQLYLSLRLAGLTQRLEAAEPVPLIVDDILVNFDDDRALATIEMLGELSRQTQVILLTHHHRLVEIARTALPDGTLYVHGLPGPAAAT